MFTVALNVYGPWNVDHLLNPRGSKSARRVHNTSATRLICIALNISRLRFVMKSWNELCCKPTRAGLQCPSYTALDFAWLCLWLSNRRILLVGHYILYHFLLIVWVLSRGRYDSTLAQGMGMPINSHHGCQTKSTARAPSPSGVALHCWLNEMRWRDNSAQCTNVYHPWVKSQTYVYSAYVLLAFKQIKPYNVCQHL